jgi:hypothetical protein
MVVATVAENGAGSANALVVPSVTVSELPSEASWTVLGIVAVPALTVTDVFETVVGATGSENETTRGADKLTLVLPRSGETIVTVGGV